MNETAQQLRYIAKLCRDWNVELHQAADEIDRLTRERDEARAVVERLHGIIRDLHRQCHAEMNDSTQGDTETVCKMWARICEAAEQARKPCDP